MSLRLFPALAGLALGVLAASTVSVASAQGFHRTGVYGSAYGYGLRGAGYAFADEAVRGSYIGAPLTRFPSPSQIVPAPWTYGTYGIPTVAGIERAPVGRPSLTVLNAREPAPAALRPRARAHILNRDADGRWAQADQASAAASGIQVIEVRVPRR